MKSYTKLYTLHEAAKMLRQHPEVTRRAAQSGKLSGGKVGRCWRFTAADLDGFVSAGRIIPPARQQSGNREMTPIDTILHQLQEIMSEIPEIAISDDSMPETEKNRLSRLYDALLLLQEKLQTMQKERPDA